MYIKSKENIFKFCVFSFDLSVFHLILKGKDRGLKKHRQSIYILINLKHMFSFITHPHNIFQILISKDRLLKIYV